MVNRSVVALSLLVTLAGCPPVESHRPEDASATATESSSSTSSTEPSVTTSDAGGADPTTSDDPSTSTTTTMSSTSTVTTDAPSPACGDGEVDNGEECDLGRANDNAGACTEMCMLPKCGDGFLQGEEECDLGPENDNYGTCTNGCMLSVCGDGFLQEGEECDEGEANNADLDGGCHPETCTLVTTCGDGVVQPDEECDPEAEDDAAAVCTDQCLIARKVIFASSLVYSGGFGGVDAADVECRKMALAAGLPNPEGFVAWLSTQSFPIGGEFEHPSYKYVRTDGAEIADGWDDLVDGTISVPIRRTEYNEDAAKMDVLVWTGTMEDGSFGGPNCEDWSSSSTKKSGLVGSVLATDHEWTNFKSNSCFYSAHLYCIET